MEKIEDYIFYSGGADGADTLWENALKEKGAKVIVYRPKHIDELGKEELEVLEEKYLEVVKKLGRKPMDINRFAGNLLDVICYKKKTVNHYMLLVQ